MNSMNRKQLVTRLDKLVQTVARYKGATYKDGWYNTCVTCGATRPIAKIQGGHFIPRGCYLTRWDYRNVWPQDERCNGFLAGNYIVYSKWMLDNYPDDYYRLTELYEKHRKGDGAVKITDIRQQYNEWLKKGRELESKIGEQLFPKTWKEDD